MNILNQQNTPGVVALIPLGLNLVKLATQCRLVLCRAAGRVDYWPVYERVAILTREEVGQELGGN